MAGFEQDGYRSTSSCYDPQNQKHRYNWVDVSAPYGGVCLNPAAGLGYVRDGGTCFSTPLVSSLALLMVSEYPQMSAWQIHDAIEANTRSVPPLLSPELPPRIDYHLALSQGGQ